MSQPSDLMRAMTVLNSVHPIVAGMTDSLAKAANETASTHDLISAGKRGVSSLERALQIIDPPPQMDDLLNQLEAIAAKKLLVEPSQADMSGVVQAQREMEVPMPSPRAIARPRLSDTERLATLVAGLLGGGMSEANSAAFAGAGARAHAENQANERQFASELATAQAKVSAAKNRLEVEKLLAEDGNRAGQREARRQLLQLDQDELGLRSRIDLLGREGALRVDELGALVSEWAGDADGWTDVDRKRLDAKVLELSQTYGLAPSKIRSALGPVREVKDLDEEKKELDAVWASVGSQFAEFVSNAKLKIDPAVVRGKFATLEARFLRGKATVDQVQGEMGAWVERLMKIEGLIARGDESSLSTALRALGAEKSRERFLLSHYRELDAGSASVRAQEAVLRLLDQMVSRALNARRPSVPVASDGRLGKQSVPGDWGLGAANPMGGEYEVPGVDL